MKGQNKGPQILDVKIMYLSHNLEYFHFLLFINTILEGRFSLFHELPSGNCLERF